MGSARWLVICWLWCLVLMAITLSGCVETVRQGPDPAEMSKIYIPTSWQKSSVVILKYDTELEFIPGDDGNRLKEREDKWYKVLSTDDYDLQYITLFEHSEIEKPVKIRARAYYPDGSEWTLLQRKIIQNEGDFADITAHSFYIPKYQKDMLVHVTVEREYVRPEFVGSYFLADDKCILERTMTVRSPQQAIIKMGLENSSHAKIKETVSNENGQQVHTITAKNLADFRERERTPYPEEYYPALYLSVPPKGMKSYSWQQLGDYYLESYEKKYTTSEAIAGLANQLPDGEDLTDVVRNSFGAVVDKVRYHFDSRGGYAFVPRDPAVVLENGYGDCKELSTILKAVLAEKDVISHPTLVSVWNYRQPLEKYPTLSGFNHMILAVKRNGPGVQYLDPTRTWADPEESYYASIGRRAFIIEPGNSRLVTITSGKNFENSVTTTSKVHYDTLNNNWVLDGRMELAGFAAQSFFEMLQESGRKDDVGLATELLTDGFEIYPRSLEVVEATPHMIQITYRSDFDAQFLPLNKGGLKLSVPSLNKNWVKRDLPDKLGPVFLNEFVQQDRWELPFIPVEAELFEDSTSIAKSAWQTEKNVVSRNYVQTETRRALADALIKRWDSKVDEIVNSVVWK